MCIINHDRMLLQILYQWDSQIWQYKLDVSRKLAKFNCSFHKDSFFDYFTNPGEKFEDASVDLRTAYG